MELKEIEEAHSDCELGIEGACDYLGYIYLEGIGVYESSLKGQKYFRKGNNINKYNSMKDKHNAKNLEYHKKACAIGRSNACLIVGNIYKYGIKVKKDIEKAIKYHKKACDLDSNIGCENYIKLKNQQKQNNNKMKQENTKKKGENKIIKTYEYMHKVKTKQFTGDNIDEIKEFLKNKKVEIFPSKYYDVFYIAEMDLHFLRENDFVTIDKTGKVEVMNDKLFNSIYDKIKIIKILTVEWKGKEMKSESDNNYFKFDDGLRINLTNQDTLININIYGNTIDTVDVKFIELKDKEEK